jgi:hypothetical protein
MQAVIADPKLVAFCGLYCGACRSYLVGRCLGCQHNMKAGWCKVRACCIARGFRTCAECREYVNPRDCKRFNGFVAKVFGLVFRSNRAACIQQIRDRGLAGHAEAMATLGRQSLPR